MGRKINIVLIGLILLLLVSSPLQADMKKLAQAGMQFLKIGVGARAVGMGETYIAVGQDANVIFWNPAGLAFIEGTDISFSHTNWIADIKQNAVAAAAEFGGLGVFGISFVTMDYGDIYRTQVDFDPSNEYGYTGGKKFGGEKIDVSEYTFGLAYSKRFSEKFSLGGHIKYVAQDLGNTRVVVSGEERISDNEVDAFAFDFGTLYYVGFQDLRLAMSILNFSRDLKYEREAFQLPLTFRVGLAMNLFSLFESIENHGGEYLYDNVLALRAGYKVNYDEEGFTAGLGLMTDTGLVVDYSYTAFGEAFGSVHRFSIGLRLK
jgi:hypothetical protein